MNTVPIFSLISTANTLNVTEGSSVVGTIQATDSDGDMLTFSITGGNDQALFLINGEQVP